MLARHMSTTMSFNPVIAVLVVVATILSAGCATEAERRKEAEKQAAYHYDLGRSYFSEKQIPQALRELLLALESKPDNADALHLLGFIYMGRFAKNYRHMLDELV